MTVTKITPATARAQQDAATAAALARLREFAAR